MSEVLEIVLFFSVPIWGRRKTNPTQTWLSVLESSELRWMFVKKQTNEEIILASLESTVYKIREQPALLPSLQCISLAPVLKQLHTHTKKRSAQLQNQQQLLHLKAALTSLNNMLRRYNAHTKNPGTRTQQASTLKHTALAAVSSFSTLTYVHTHSSPCSNQCSRAKDEQQEKQQNKTWSQLQWLQFAESTTSCRN